MSARLSKEDRLERLVAKTRKRIDDNPVRSLSHSPDSLLGTLVREAGYERTSAKLLETLQNRLADAGIATCPDINNPSNTSRTRIHFFDRRKAVQGYQPPRHLFAEEKELSRFLVMNKDVLK